LDPFAALALEPDVARAVAEYLWREIAADKESPVAHGTAKRLVRVTDPSFETALIRANVVVFYSSGMISKPADQDERQRSRGGSTG
jgi:hypothetical protein